MVLAPSYRHEEPSIYLSPPPAKSEDSTLCTTFKGNLVGRHKAVMISASAQPPYALKIDGPSTDIALSTITFSCPERFRPTFQDTGMGII